MKLDNLYIPKDPVLRTRRRWRPRWPVVALALAVWMGVWYFGVIYVIGR